MISNEEFEQYPWFFKWLYNYVTSEWQITSTNSIRTPIDVFNWEFTPEGDYFWQTIDESFSTLSQEDFEQFIKRYNSKEFKQKYPEYYI